MTAFYSILKISASFKGGGMKESKITLKPLFSVFRLDIIGIAILIMLVPGCASNRMYSGPALPSNQVAFLERGSDELILRSFDGRQNFFLNIKEFEILPGKHTVEIGYSDGHSHSRNFTTLTFTAKQGTRYVIKSNVNFGYVHPQRGYVRPHWNPSIVEK
jgi:hypothetical protein